MENAKTPGEAATPPGDQAEATAQKTAGHSQEQSSPAKGGGRKAQESRWVEQTLFGGEVGNCLAACVASIFGISLDEVPNFVASGDGWERELREWASARGFSSLRFHLEGSVEQASERLAEWLPGTLSIVSGEAERGLQHATVWRGGQLVHDPHPSHAGLLDVVDVIAFVPRDPAEALAKRRGSDER